MSVQYQSVPRPVGACQWSQFFLDRLDRLTRLTPEFRARFNAEQLLRHAIYSTYLDCRECEAVEPAQTILDRVRGRALSTPGPIT
ncbi:MAG TPA: hypothetical protein VKX96_05730 [Chloroflexota bacterium]|nr:hypothetical protein [Chloroflexota bacterium]